MRSSFDAPVGDRVGACAGPEIANAVVSEHGGGRFAIENDPSNEAREIWEEAGDGLLIVAMFCGVAVLLIVWLAGRAVIEPLHRVSAALYRIGEGEYGRRAPKSGRSELAALAACFNHRADRLAAIEMRNRGLDEQLLTLQEEKRAALARDLHDEIGPYVFVIKVDATTNARLIELDACDQLDERPF